MKYKSTRGTATHKTFEQVLFAGYAEDGGLYVPTHIPKVDASTLNTWKEQQLSYPDVVTEVIKLFISEDEMPLADQKECVAKAYSKFAVPETLRMKSLWQYGDLHVAELFHGKTASFKDYALALVGQLIEYFTRLREQRTIILVGTSGDTGSAAIEAVAGLPSVDIIVLYPKKNISEIQELQMNASHEKNVHVFAVEGTSDDLDVPIKASIPSPGITTINSINWARIMVQIAHYVYLYIHCDSQELDIYVPTGAAGNIVSGVYAHMMGIPISLYGATNENDNVYNLLKYGKFQLGGKVVSTPANAMDILYPYNVERLLALFTVDTVVEKLMTDGHGVASKDVLHGVKSIVKDCFRVDTDLIYKTVKKCWEKTNYMICPHTATALAFYEKRMKANEITKNTKSVIISTASAKKFLEVSIKLGIDPQYWNGLSLLNHLKESQPKEPKIMKRDDDWFQILQARIKKIQNMYSK